MAPAGADGISTGSLTVCVDDECKEGAFRPVAGASTLVEIPDLTAGIRVTATLAMPDGSRYEGEGDAAAIRPNGPGCDPTCVRASITLRPEP